MPTVKIISLGCSRNLVDSEVVAGSLKKEGYRITEGESADLCVVNTCAFIEKAREESVEAILEAAELKKRGKVRILAVCGCLPQLYKDRLADELPEVDLIVGAGDFPKLGRIVKRLAARRGIAISPRSTYLYDEHTPRILSTPPHYAYIKIAEGCSNHCTYCIISRLRGPFRSRTVRSVLAEARHLSRGGALREINLVGQDTTRFGSDRGSPGEVADLLRRLAALRQGPAWIRLLYTHPAHYTDELIEVIAGESKVCKYVDLPIQHAGDKILRLMNRRTTRCAIERLIGRLRERIPELILRTSIICGFPGETEADFAELISFVRDMQFDRLGAFAYSREEATPAGRMRGQVSERVKAKRLDRLMTIQRAISLAKNRRLVGKTMPVLIDEKDDDRSGAFLGRTQGDAPEVDGGVCVTGKNLKPGMLCDVKITGAMEYDLIGKSA